MAIALALFTGACDQMRNDPRGHPLPESPPLVSTVLSPVKPDPRSASYQNNAFQVSNGQLYFHWMNCTGCHSEGGGGIGPSLMDANWRYGGTMEDIVQSISNGRPNGMPGFGGKMTAAQIWQTAAYVRSLSQHVPQSIRGGRMEGLSVAEPSTLRDPKPYRAVTPKQDEATVK